MFVHENQPAEGGYRGYGESKMNQQVEQKPNVFFVFSIGINDRNESIEISGNKWQK